MIFTENSKIMLDKHLVKWRVFLECHSWNSEGAQFSITGKTYPEFGFSPESSFVWIPVARMEGK